MKNAEEENSVVELYLQCTPDTVAARARVDMVDQVRLVGLQAPKPLTLNAAAAHRRGSPQLLFGSE